MHKGILLALGICLAAASTVSAQVLGWAIACEPVVNDERPREPAGVAAVPTAAWMSYGVSGQPTVQSSDPQAPVPAAAALPMVDFSSNRSGPVSVWASAGYLMAWLKSTPVPVPLVTTGNLADADPGAIGQPGTRVLFGDSSVGFNSFNGMRAVLGAWLDGEGTIGVEGGGFVLERRRQNYYAASDEAGTPLLAFPFFNQTPTFTGEDALRLSDPRPFVGQVSGNVLVASSVQLWGTEINGVFNLYRSRLAEFSLLAGFRYVDLQESLQITSATTDLLTDPTVTVLHDSFNTRNQFYGGQLGGRLSVTLQRWSLDATGLVALGSNHEVIDIQGSTVQSGPIAVTPGTFPGGFFTQPSNLGHYSKNQFAVLPTLQLKLSYELTSAWSLFVAYDILYWNQVVRPGDQIDRNINLNQNTPLGFGGVPGGPAAPAPLFQRTDFWAQSVMFGIQCRF